MKDTVTTVDGVRAIELYYRAVKETAGGETVFFQSQIRLNAPTMGVLSPADYTNTFEKSRQCEKIFELAFRQFLTALKRFSERGIQYDWISVCMPIRYLKRIDCAEHLAELCKKALIHPEHICFEFTCYLFKETDKTAAESIHRLREKGFHIMLTGAGGALPIFKLGDYEADYVLLHPDAVLADETNERQISCLRSVISLINELGADAIVCDVTQKSTVKLFNSLECVYYTGLLSGKFVTERYMRARNKNESDNE